MKLDLKNTFLNAFVLTLSALLKTDTLFYAFFKRYVDTLAFVNLVSVNESFILMAETLKTTLFELMSFFNKNCEQKNTCGIKKRMGSYFVKESYQPLF